MPDPLDRAAELRADYEQLGIKLRDANGSGAAALVRERRLISELLEALETPEEVPFVDQLEPRRRAKAGPAGQAKGRRKSG